MEPNARYVRFLLAWEVNPDITPASPLLERQTDTMSLSPYEDHFLMLCPLFSCCGSNPDATPAPLPGRQMMLRPLLPCPLSGEANPDATPTSHCPFPGGKILMLHSLLHCPLVGEEILKLHPLPLPKSWCYTGALPPYYESWWCNCKGIKFPITWLTYVFKFTVTLR